MAMVRQQTEGEIINGSTPEDDNQSEHMDNFSGSRPASRSSSGSKRNSPVMPTLQYSKDDLMKYSSLPLSQTRPSYLDPAYNNSMGKWDPERWYLNHRSDRATVLDEPRTKRDRQEDILSGKRKSSDPKERIKEEKDDIVLSPQRRSFGTGCHVIPQSSLARRPGSPTDNRDSDSFRDSSRRIGSGRIMRDQRDWERDREYGYGTRTERRDRFDQDENDKDLRRYSSSRYNRNDRRSRGGRDRIDEVEPEWFSSGPTSQSETIELVGFEDPRNDDENRRPAKKGKRKQNSRRSSLKSDEGEKQEPVIFEEDNSQKKIEKEITKPINEETEEKAQETETKDEKPITTGFEVDDLFKIDWMPPEVMPGTSPPPNVCDEISCSRFSQWFQRRDSPLNDMVESANHSRRSSLQEELIENVLNKPKKTVQELEADLKKLVLGDQKHREEKSAFDKLMQHMSDSRNSPTTSLSIGPLDKSKAVQEQDLIQDMLRTNQPISSASPVQQMFQMFEEKQNIFKLPPGMSSNQFPQQQSRESQNDMFAHLLQQRQHEQHMQQMQQPQLLQNQLHQQSQGLTVDMLTKLLASPTRTMVNPLQAPSNLNLADPQVNLFGQQPPALSHAPAPIHPAALAQAMVQNAANSNTLQVQNPVVLQRVPSPQELAVHTQSILQNALIKRKLEEQKENFRKRQEAQRANSPVATSKNGMTPSPLKGLSPTIAFTPTSVMRKIQSEKVENKEQKITLQNGSEPRLCDPSQTFHKSTTVNLPNTGLQSTFDSGLNVLNNSHFQASYNTNAGLNQGPRAVHGQGTNQPRSIHGGMNSVTPLVIQNQGRPIVKVGMNQLNSSSDLSRPGMVPSKTSMTHNKSFISSNNQGHGMHHDMDPNFDALNKFSWHQQMARQQQQQNTSSMPPLQMAATFAALNQRPPPINPHHSGLLRPATMSSNVPPSNMNYPLLRNSVQNPLRAQTSNQMNQLNQLGQIAALQFPRGSIENRQFQALAQSQRFHPAIQQMLLNSQNQVTAAQAQVVAGFPGNRDKHQHLLPGQGSTNRSSPVNLAKWFGNDVLKQKMPDMPPVSHQKALLVEEVERQQQSTVVHN